MTTTKPTPDEIEATIAGMVGLGPLGPGDPDASYAPLWWVIAIDPQGNERGIGTDHTLAGARAAAWVLSHDEIADHYGRVPLSMDAFCCVPRDVPDGWTFEIDDMPTQARA